MSVSVHTDTVDGRSETLTLTLSNAPAGVDLTRAAATGTIAAGDGPTAWFESVPAEHDGSTTFLLQLVLSEDLPGLSYKVVRNDLLSIANGTRESAPRTAAGRNDRWDVYVTPASTAAVTVTVNDGVPLPGGRTPQGGAAATVPGPDADVRDGGRRRADVGVAARPRRVRRSASVGLRGGGGRRAASGSHGGARRAARVSAFSRAPRR